MNHSHKAGVSETISKENNQNDFFGVIVEAARLRKAVMERNKIHTDRYTTDS
jgi:hypothetical protein